MCHVISRQYLNFAAHLGPWSKAAGAVLRRRAIQRIAPKGFSYREAVIVDGKNEVTAGLFHSGWLAQPGHQQSNGRSDVFFFFVFVFFARLG